MWICTPLPTPSGVTMGANDGALVQNMGVARELAHDQRPVGGAHPGCWPTGHLVLLRTVLRQEGDDVDAAYAQGMQERWAEFAMPAD
jgi:hypothetical protein